MTSGKAGLICVIFVLMITVCYAAEPEINVVPWPQSITMNPGTMVLDGGSRIIYDDPALLDLGNVLKNEINDVCGLLPSVTTGSPSSGDILLKFTSDPGITDEEYRLTVDTYATVEAENYNAAAMGTVTLLQAIIVDTDITLPKMVIDDYPDAEYRGLLIDVARQYHSPDTLKELIQMCRLYKIRYMQIHLSDDQSFTFPSTAYPLLTNYSHHYSMAEMTNLVSYADKRGVILIPEIDVPAHASAMCKAMPALFASPVNGIINFADTDVWDAMDTIINEVCDVFQTAPYFHLGADEASIWSLSSDPEFQAAISTYGVGDIEGLFNYFISYLDDTIKARGKKTIVWEGFNYNKTGNAKMDTDISTMMFDNYKNPQSYIDKGHDVINASWCPLYINGGSIPEQIYDWDKFLFGGYSDPFPRRYDATYWYDITPTSKIPGAQMCSWEFRETDEYDIIHFRLPPYADRIWNPDNTNGFDHFNTRYESTDTVLTYLLMDHSPPNSPIDVGASNELYPDKIRVGWWPGGNFEFKYALYRNTTNNSASASLIDDEIPISQTDYVDTAVVTGQRYYYWVKAWNKYGWSSFSSVASGRTGTAGDFAIAYEGFEYTGGSSIDGKNGGVGWDDAWNITSSNGSITVENGSLSYDTLNTTGGRLNFQPATDLPSIYVERHTDGNIGYDMSTVWFSFLIRGNRIRDGHTHLTNGIGKKWANGFGFTNKPVLHMENGETYFVVARYDCRPGNDNCYLWINPPLGPEPPLDSADTYIDSLDIGYHSIMQFNIQGYGQGDYDFDEFRYATTWEKVTGMDVNDFDPPTPNPMTWNTSPEAVSYGSITMTADTASDANGVEYYFEETSGNLGGDDSDWQTSPIYTDDGLEPNTRYSYRVKARDRSPNNNETGWSSVEYATTFPLPGTITDVALNSSGNIEIAFEGGTSSWKIETSTSPYDYNESNMTWAVEATGVSGDLWEDTATPTIGEKYYHLKAGGELIAYEPFDYSAGTQIAGLNGYPSMWGGAWLSTYYPYECSIYNPGLSYPGLPSLGNSLMAAIYGSTPAQRQLKQSISSGTYWMSFLFEKFDQTGTFYVMLNNEDLMVGLWGASSAWLGYDGSFYEDSSIDIMDGNTHLFILRLDFNVTSLDAYLWIDPDLGLGEPQIVSADASLSKPSAVVWQSLQMFGEAGPILLLDEFRIGESFYSVISGGSGGDSETVGMMIANLVIGRNMVSSPFEPYPDGEVGGGGTMGQASLDKIIGTQLTGHPVSQWASDKIEAWDADLQTYVGAWLRAGLGWMAWDTMDTLPAFGIDSDAGYWIKLNNVAKNVKLFGHVAKEDRSIEVKMNRNMIGSCFPVSCSLTQSNLVGSGFNGHAVSQWASDKLEFWNAAGQTYVGVWYRAGQGWRAWDSMDNPPAAPYDAIDPCKGWWIKVNNTPFTWTYKAPPNRIVED